MLKIARPKMPVEDLKKEKIITFEVLDCQKLEFLSGIFLSFSYDDEKVECG